QCRVLVRRNQHAAGIRQSLGKVEKDVWPLDWLTACDPKEVDVLLSAQSRAPRHNQRAIQCAIEPHLLKTANLLVGNRVADVRPTDAVLKECTARRVLTP